MKVLQGMTYDEFIQSLVRRGVTLHAGKGQCLKATRNGAFSVVPNRGTEVIPREVSRKIEKDLGLV